MAKENKELIKLWSAFLAGEEAAFSRLFFDYYELLYHYGYRITPKPEFLKDVLQDFFLNLYESRASLSPDVKNLRAYLITSFRRRLLLELKRQRRTNSTLEDIVDKEDHLFDIGIEDVLIKRESSAQQKQLVGELLDNLPPRQREIIYLRYYLDLSLPEIAKTLQISYQVVANHLYRALKKLQGSSTIKRFFKMDIWLLLSLYPLLGF
ncbi:RNA polymerase sigma factor [Flavilitoribacter nigricans]|nr:sigma-70 family RNA polymerase sigma factor [Flavilitoribacter nigricans]